MFSSIATAVVVKQFNLTLADLDIFSLEFFARSLSLYILRRIPAGQILWESIFNEVSRPLNTVSLYFSGPSTVDEFLPVITTLTYIQMMKK